MISRGQRSIVNHVNVYTSDILDFLKLIWGRRQGIDVVGVWGYDTIAYDLSVLVWIRMTTCACVFEILTWKQFMTCTEFKSCAAFCCGNNLLSTNSACVCGYSSRKTNDLNSEVQRAETYQLMIWSLSLNTEIGVWWFVCWSVCGGGGGGREGGPDKYLKHHWVWYFSWKNLLFRKARNKAGN